MNDLNYTQGQDNLPGLVDVIYVVAQSDVDDASLPVLGAVYGGDTTNLSIAGNIVLKAGKKFGALYLVDESAESTIKSIGPRDSKGVEVMLTGRYPRVDRNSLAWLRGIQNGPLLLIYRQANTSKRYIMGISGVEGSNAPILNPPVYFEEVDGKTGKARGDENGLIFSFKWTGNHGPVEYNGTIDVTP
jgi:hypothetical protein